MHRHTHQRIRIAAVSLLAVILLCGCKDDRSGTIPTTAAPYEESTEQSYEHFEERQLLEQKQFQTLMDQTFRDNICGSQLDMHYLLKDPSVYSITKADNLYSPISVEAMLQNASDRKELEDALNAFDPALLDEEQRRTLRVLQSFLSSEKLADGLELYAQPLAVTIGLQAQLPILLSEYLFYDRQDIDDYFSLLGGIDEYYAQILQFEKEKSAAGLMMSDITIDHIIESCENYLLVPGDNFMIDTFEERLKGIPDLSEEETAAYLEKNAALLESDFVPAYRLLIDGLSELKGTGTNPGGQAGYPEGKKYYEYLVSSATGTSCNSIEDLLKAMETMLDRNIEVTSSLLRENPGLLDQMNTYEFRQKEPEAIMEELKQCCLPLYPALPECHYTFKDVPKALESSLSPAFYIVSPLDDCQNNVIYINHNPDYSSNDLYIVIAHEGYPGHLYQNIYFHTNCDSPVRQILSFPGYTEGWATYVETNAYTLDNGISEDLGRLLAANYMATLGISACLDIYINYMNWDLEQVKEYLGQFNADPDSIAASVYQSIIEKPSNYLSYYVGCMEFQNMERVARKTLGKKYDEKTFHTFLLDFGSAPFDVIQPYFTTWLNEQKG